MPKITACTAVVVTIAFSALTLPAQAQLYVSAAGNDANNCDRFHPCQSLGTAVDKASTGNSIVCLDPFPSGGPISITKSLTIDCSQVTGQVSVAQNIGNTEGLGIRVNGAGIQVVLRGLFLDSDGTGTVAIDFVQGTALRVENCTIQNFRGGAATGIRFAPSGSGQLFVSDTTIAFSGSPTSGGGGIFVDPGAGSALVTLDRVRLERNFEGFRASGAGGGAVFATVRDSLASTNGSYGFIAVTPSGGAPVFMDIQHTTSTLNGGAGIRASGPGVQVLLSNSSLTANSTGFSPANGGTIFSYGNNVVAGNTVDGVANGSGALR